ncbi:hypothetical protein AAMO2058_000784500, partial [Amorphochlora amoebiformis]
MLAFRNCSLGFLHAPAIRKAAQATPIVVAGVAIARSVRRLAAASQKKLVKTKAEISPKIDPWNAFEKLPLRLEKDPPIPKKVPHEILFGAVSGEEKERGGPKELIVPPKTIKDPYFWIRDDDRKRKDVISHLEAENAYTNYMTHHLRAARENIYQEILSHIQETDVSVPHPRGKYEYYDRTEEGKSYQIHCRKLKSAQQPQEDIFLNENEIAKDKKHCDIYDWDVSPSQTLLAYSADFTGDEEYTLYLKDLSTGKFLQDEIPKTIGRVLFGDEKTLFYATMDESRRTDKVWMHRIGTPNSKDVLLYHEPDSQFDAGFSKSSSKRFLFLSSSSSETEEHWVIDLEEKGSYKKKCVRKREKGVIYEVDHHDKDFYIITNLDKSTNFKLTSIPVEKVGTEAKWEDVFPYDPAIKIDDIHCFSNFIALEGREDGFSQVWIFKPENPKDSRHVIKFQEEAHTVGLSVNEDFGSSVVRITYESFICPRCTYDYDPSDRKLTLLKQQPVPKYDPSLYSSERLEVLARDGKTKIPVSLVYRTDMKSDKPGPVHLYGYGSYEISIEPQFAATRLPLLDRGVTYAIAHVRGGGEMGRSWYESAKYSHKSRTFTDFIDCAKNLIDRKTTTPDLMSIEGRSAGGLLVGAVLNMAPSLFKAGVAGVPFVDVMGTMSDPSIPLTTGEWEEWGNPNTLMAFNDIIKYSPYDNIAKQNYPSLFISGGLFDPRVAYWEPAKWAAKLREYKTDDNPVLLKIDLDSGHFSASDRYR